MQRVVPCEARVNDLVILIMELLLYVVTLRLRAAGEQIHLRLLFVQAFNIGGSHAMLQKNRFFALLLQLGGQSPVTPVVAGQ